MPEKNKPMVPFMDTFYSLSSNDPSERNNAASSLLQYIFVVADSANEMDESDGEKSQQRFNASIKDGCYAITRLLTGLCSGRASARQGYASCLSSFLKLAFQSALPKDVDSSHSCWMDHFMEEMNESKDPSLTKVEFVRTQLLKHTSPAESLKDKNGLSKRAVKKGSEERDYMFGKLFGILAVVRSNTLEVDDSDSSFENLNGYVSDLISLYHLKTWMREPATHAIKELLQFISTHSNKVVAKLVNDGRLSRFLASDRSWSAEKIALYLHLQTHFSEVHADSSSIKVPDILKTPLLTVSSLKGKSKDSNINLILRDTSSVVHPRCHIVWESVWSYLCGKDKSKAKNKGAHKNLILRKKISIGSDSPADIVKALVNNVIIQGLLGQTDAKNITHERRALAMSLISQLCQLQLPPDVLEGVVLHPTIIQKIFLQTLQKSTKGGNKLDQKNAHTLKPLALTILQHIVKSLHEEENNVDRRLAAIRSFLQANLSFDSITQTQTVSSLLGLNTNQKGVAEKDSPTSSDYELWEQYIVFLQKELFEKLRLDDGAVKATRYVDLLYNFSKHVAHVAEDDRREYFFRRTALMFAVGAFFDLDSFSLKSNVKKIDGNDIRCIAQNVCADLKQNDVLISIPHNVRVIMSSRFFSLLSDYLATDKRGKLKSTKISLINTEVSHLQNEITVLEANGATLVNKGSPIDAVDGEGGALLPFESSLKICSNLEELIAKGGKEKDEMKSLGLSAILCLVSSLSLQLLHPGQPSTSGSDHIDEEDEVDEVFDEIHEILCDLSEVASAINQDEIDVEDNPLSALAAVSVNILNSSIGGSTLIPCTHLGAASRLTRDCVQTSWSSVLPALSDDSSGSNSLLGEEVMGLLLESVCSPQSFSDPMVSDEEDDNSEAGETDSSDNEANNEELNAFTEANASGVDLDDMEVDEDSEQKDVDEDIELEPSALENLLLEDRDDVGSEEETELEHHSGADSALAQLIKMKQDARKAAQSKRDKIELLNRLRCFSLLDPVFASKRKLSNQTILLVILPLLRTRTILLKSIISSASSISAKSGSSIAEKRNLIDRITSFLKDKVCKIQFSEATNVDACRTLSKEIMVELKSVFDIDHRKLCSSLLVVVVKASGENELDLSRNLSESIYHGAVKEWSQKKNSKLQSFVFDDLINKRPSLAKNVLISELILASKEARSPYLKSEAFRMLAVLFKVTADDGSGVESTLKKTSVGFSDSLTMAINDEEMVKAKRVRDVLKAAEELVDFTIEHGDESIWGGVNKMIPPLKNLNNSTGSGAIKSLTEKLEKKISKGFEERVIPMDATPTASTATPDKKSTKSNKAKKSAKKKKKKGKK